MGLLSLVALVSSRTSSSGQELLGYNAPVGNPAIPQREIGIAADELPPTQEDLFVFGPLGAPGRPAIGAAEAAAQNVELAAAARRIAFDGEAE